MTSLAPQSGSQSSLGTTVALAAGPLAALCVYAALSAWAPDLAEAGRRVGAVLAWMAVWWLTEALPLSVTALLPIPLFPLLGVMSTKDAAAPFADKVIFLFMAGFMMALAMERSNLHRRIALVTLRIVGAKPVRVVLGFMLSTSFLSMWMSNTATAVMMFPIALSVIALVKERTGGTHDNFALCLLLGVAYSASIGGVATPIGTPPNAFLLAFVRAEYGLEISFFQWMLVGVPMVLLFIPITWMTLTRVVYRIRLKEIPGGPSFVAEEIARLGPVTRAEWSVMGVFAVAVTGWLARDPLALLAPSLKPFLTERLDDTVVGLIAATLLFIVPLDLGKRRFLLDWATAERIPWGILLLFGGGLSLAAGVRSSGLDLFIGEKFSAFAGMPTVAIVLLVSGVLIFLTEVTSNTATATIFFPIIAGAAPALGIDPLLLLIPAAMGVSCAFMLPMATPPNALVFATGEVSIRQMAKAGLILNFISIGLVTLIVYTAGVWFLGADPSGVPESRQTAPTE